MLMKFLIVFSLFLLPAMAEAPDIPGIPKSREGAHIQIGNTRIRLGGIDAPSVDQLCLNHKGERWSCGVAARDEQLMHDIGQNRTWHGRQTIDRLGRTVARCEVDGEESRIARVKKARPLSCGRVSRDYEADEKE